MHPVARVSINKYRNLRTQQMLVHSLVCIYTMHCLVSHSKVRHTASSETLCVNHSPVYIPSVSTTCLGQVDLLVRVLCGYRLMANGK
jgi:hypothetical protein